MQFVSREIVEASLYRALQRLLSEDAYLFEIDVNERSLTHRLALYLGQEFPEWDVDCEYNRKGDVPKVVATLPLNPTQDDEHARTVFPDIIVHHRGTRDNLLVIEAKKSSNPEGDLKDHVKLTAYSKTFESRGLQYAHGASVMLHVRPAPAGAKVLRWYP
jgi:hypothetical protein